MQTGDIHHLHIWLLFRKFAAVVLILIKNDYGNVS